MASEVDVFIVTYRSEAYLPALLGELKATSRLSHRLRIEDNTSNRLTLTALWNDLWRGSSCEFAVFLNPDIRLSASWDERLLDCMARRPEVAVAMPNRYLRMDGPPTLEKMNQLADSMGPRPSHKDLGTHLEGFYAFMVRRSALDRLKGFDERFRFYFSDSDFQLRALKIGMKTVQVNHCPVVHVGMVSTREAMRRGELDRDAELLHVRRTRQEMEAGRLRPWHELTDKERGSIRLDPHYNRLPSSRR